MSLKSPELELKELSEPRKSEMLQSLPELLHQLYQLPEENYQLLLQPEDQPREN